MANELLIHRLMAPYGFEPHDVPGFVGVHREHPDGRFQQVHFCWWRNPRVADRQGRPHGYLVVCPTLDDPLRSTWIRPQEDGRYIIPTVEWPSAVQPKRPWEDVADEFRAIIAPLLEAPLAEGRAGLDALSDRYSLLIAAPLPYAGPPSSPNPHATDR